ncbi:MAG: Smr/MutS family protein [Rikenellaceae bacterium]
MTSRERLEQKLGFDRIRSLAESRCSTALARNRVIEADFLTSYTEIESKLAQTDEMRVIAMFESSFPDSGFVDTLPFLKQLEVQSSYLDVLSIARLKQSLETTRTIVTFFKNTKEELYPNLKLLVEPIVLFPEITRRIEAILDKFGEIRDNASPELQTIRKSIKDKESTISKRISSILKKAQSEGLADEEATVSVRDGKVLIPVSAANKRKISGFIYDESASGKTAYIEPMEIVELNNQVRELHFAEQREILKILILFSDFLRPYLPELLAAADFLGEIDFIRAKALLAMSMQAGKPILSREQELFLIKGRHPLLEMALKREGKEIVPLSLNLSREKHILLISGPNAGGKSVCLKTVGLLQYMLQCGFLIPASEISELGIFNSIFIDIGDEQSIENDLSTYSSHLKNMRDILSEADSRSLVLIDEFGAGTEPTAGGAIAEAILNEIENRGAFGVITTHYSNLKFYASSSKGVINGGMQFDVQNIKPLFKLEIGTPGSSFAFELARKMGLPEAVVKAAEERAGSDFVDLEKHLKKIAKNRRLWEEKLARIKTTDKTLENITDKYQKELSDIQILKKSIISEAKEEARRILSDANRKIESTIKEIRENQAEKEKTKELRKSLDIFNKELSDAKQSSDDEMIARKMEQLARRKERREERNNERQKRENTPALVKAVVKNTAPEPLKAGDKVRIKGSDLIGEVLRVDSVEVNIAIGSIISKTSKDKVEKISNSEYQAASKSQIRKNSYQDLGVSERKLNFKPTIDIRGQRLDEAMDSVNHFIDDALMLGISEVKILHGKGNGILREEIRKYLKTVGGVGAMRDEHLELGGSGITVITLL